MARLTIQIHPTRAPELDVAKIIMLCERLEENETLINAVSTAEGKDDGPYVNVVFDTDNTPALWPILRTHLFQNRNVGQQISRAAIVTCEGRHGWDDYLLLYHFDQTLTLDEFE